MSEHPTSSRRASLMRLELADQIRLFLEGDLDGESLVDWAMDHPFFEDQSELSPDDMRLIGHALGSVLQMSPQTPLAERTTRESLAEVVRELARP